MNAQRILLIVAASCLGMNMAAAEKTITVEPGESLAAARDAVRAWHADHPGKAATVLLKAGRHPLAETLVLTAEDSHTSWQGEEGTVVTGGIPVTGVTVAGDGTWRAPLPAGSDIPDQLVIDGAWGTVARWPDPEAKNPALHLARLVHDSDAKGIAQHAAIHLAEDPGDTLPESGYTVVVMKFWALFRQRVERREGRVLHLPSPTFFQPPRKSGGGGNLMTVKQHVPKYRAWFEGHPAFVTRPGEWAVDAAKRELVYRPLPGQDPETTRIELPVLRQLVRIEGRAAAPVIALGFDGITFTATADPLPPTGHDGRQAAGVYGPSPKESHDPVGAVAATHWQGGTLVGCDLVALGGQGVQLAAGCRDIHLVGCRIADVGANGIMIGTPHDPQVEADQVRHCQVHDCLVERTGRTWFGGVGIWQGFAAEGWIAHNEIRELPYTGVSLGWRWNSDPSMCGKNTVENNHIHRCMLVLGDGGGIYTLGHQPGSVLKGNHIHHVLRSELNHGSPNNGIYPDQGSSGILITDNVIHDVAESPVRCHGRGGMNVDVVANVLVPAPKISAGVLSPPYDKRVQFWRPTETVEPEQVRWRDNRILDPKAWQAEKDSVLEGREIGPRAPWRERLGL